MLSWADFPADLFLSIFCIPCGCPILLWIPSSVPLLPAPPHPSHSQPLQPGLHSSGAIWNHILLSSWSIRHVCAWTCELLPFTYQHCSSFTLSFPWIIWKGLVETLSVLYHGKVSSVAPWQSRCLPTSLSCCATRSAMTVEYRRVSQDLRWIFRLKPILHDAWWQHSQRVFAILKD